ncbi:MAG: HAMP domain-containing histidine kinase [Treponema sp.]|jgi:signal transduction histidine kinase|nr:HAMP domain-containing histidine kinase [Treponema sp.]
MISLQNRLTLTYALFISIALAVLILAMNQFTGIVFAGLIRENIAEKSGDIVRGIGEQYNPIRKNFDTLAVEAMGMYFVHEGYIISVADEEGNPVWDARSCDMEQCAEVINSIAERMEKEFRLNGSLQKQQFPLKYLGRSVGNVTIETWGPFFYSETETEFLRSINRFLIAAGFVFIVSTIVISVLLSRTIVRPILEAKEAARHIAAMYAKGNTAGKHTVRIHENHKTRELAELSRSINELAGELDESERRQKQLTSDIAHELRTPLTCLQGNIEAMIDGVWKADGERLASCHEEVIRLGKLVEDLNILTSLEWNDIVLDRTDFDLAALLNAAAGQFTQAAAEKDIAVNLHLAESPINADYNRLKQVFINILSNAVKYTDGGSITVSVKKGEKNWDVSIADTGIGMAENETPHVFERFYRSDKSRSRSTGGAGIGLTIASAIVRAHGGSIGLESSEAGSTFTVRL